MDKLFNAASVIAGVAGGAAAAMFGAWDKTLLALAAVMVMDYVTGVIKAVYSPTLSEDEI